MPHPIEGGESSYETQGHRNESFALQHMRKDTHGRIYKVNEDGRVIFEDLAGDPAPQINRESWE